MTLKQPPLGFVFRSKSVSAKKTRFDANLLLFCPKSHPSFSILFDFVRFCSILFDFVRYCLILLDAQNWDLLDDGKTNIMQKNKKRAAFSCWASF